MKFLDFALRAAKALPGVALLQPLHSWAQEVAPAAMKIASMPSAQLIRDPPGWPVALIALIAFMAFLAFASVCVIALFARASRNDRELKQQLAATIAELARQRSRSD